MDARLPFIGQGVTMGMEFSMNGPGSDAHWICGIVSFLFLVSILLRAETGPRGNTTDLYKSDIRSESPPRLQSWTSDVSCALSSLLSRSEKCRGRRPSNLSSPATPTANIDANPPSTVEEPSMETGTFADAEC